MSLDQLLAELRVEYIAALPIKIREIEDHFKTDNTAQLRNDFHKLKGSGSTYGIPEISELCEVAERLCDKMPRHSSMFAPAVIALLQSIHAERKQEKPFALNSSVEYSKICALL